jgi:hypothetical protein
MRRAGYKKLSAKPVACKLCQQPGCEWWQTTNGKKVLFDAMPGDTSSSQRHVCPDAEDLRRQAAAQPAARPGVPTSAPTIEREIKRLREATNARLVVLLNDEGAEIVAWRTGIPGEDLRQELITVANHVRNAIQKEAR